MRDDIARTGLTSLLAAILASAGTAAILAPSASPAQVAPAASIARPGLDAETSAALAEIRDAVRAVEDAVRSTPAPALPAGRVPAATRVLETEGDVSAERDSPGRKRKRGPGPARLSSTDSLLPQNTARVQRFLDEYARWTQAEDDGAATSPSRRYLLLSVESFVEEFGHPTLCGEWSGGFRCTWVIDGKWVCAYFVDGYCMQVEGA